MKLDAMFLTEKAVNAQTLSVDGALWDGLTATAFPASHTVPVVLLLRPLPGDVGRVFPVQLHVNAADGDAVMAGHSHLDITCNTYRQQTAVVVEVPCVFPRAATYTLRFDGDIGTDTLGFQVVGPGQSAVATAVEGYALGLQQR